MNAPSADDVDLAGTAKSPVGVNALYTVVGTAQQHER
jgi:hypothetical protein